MLRSKRITPRIGPLEQTSIFFATIYKPCSTISSAKSTEPKFSKQIRKLMNSSEPTPIRALIPTVMSDTTRISTTANEAPKLRQGLIVNSTRLYDRYFQEFETRDNPSLQQALDASMQFCLDMASPHVAPYWLTFLGPSGTGKTMLTKCISRFFHARLDMLPDENFFPAQFIRRGGVKPWANVITDMLGGDFTGLRDLKDDWFVALDDIGAESDRHKELSVAKLYDVLNCRIRKFTVINCNFSLDDINRRMDARIASRLLRHGSVVVDIDANDFNL